MNAHDRADHEDGYQRVADDYRAVMGEQNVSTPDYRATEEALAAIGMPGLLPALERLSVVDVFAFIDATADTAECDGDCCSDCCAAPDDEDENPFTPLTGEELFDLIGRRFGYAARLEHDESSQGWFAAAVADLDRVAEHCAYLAAESERDEAEYEVFLDAVAHDAADQIATLTTQLEQERARTAAQRRELDTLEVHYDTVVGDLAEARNDRDALATSLFATTKSADAALNRNTDLQARIAELEADLANVTEEGVGLLRQLASATHANASYLDTIATLIG